MSELFFVSVAVAFALMTIYSTSVCRRRQQDARQAERYAAACKREMQAAQYAASEAKRELRDAREQISAAMSTLRKHNDA